MKKIVQDKDKLYLESKSPSFESFLVQREVLTHQYLRWGSNRYFIILNTLDKCILQYISEFRWMETTWCFPFFLLQNILKNIDIPALRIFFIASFILPFWWLKLIIISIFWFVSSSWGRPIDCLLICSFSFFLPSLSSF